MAAGGEGMLVRQALPPTSQVPTTRQEASGEAPEEGSQGRPGGAEAHSLGEVGKTVCVSEVRPPEPGQEAEGLQGFLCPGVPCGLLRLKFWSGAEKGPGTHPWKELGCVFYAH